MKKEEEMWVYKGRYEKDQKLLRVINIAFPMTVENAKRLVDGDYPTEKAAIILRNEAELLISKKDDKSSIKEQLEALSPHEIKSMTVSDLAVLANKLNMMLDIHLTPLREEEPNENNQTELRDPDTDI